MAGKSFSYNFIINGAVNNSLISSFGRVNRLTQTMSIQNIDLKNSIAQINNAFRSGTVSSATYAARMKELSSAQRAIASTALKSSSSSLFFSAANLQNTVGTIRSIAAPIESAVKTAMSFEAAMSKVKAITMADNEETKQLTDTARELGEKTQYTASQAAEAMSFLGMAGWKTNQIIAGMPGLLNLAAAGGTDLAKTADIVSDDLTAFGLDAEAAGHMADVYAVAITKTNTNVEMLGETMKYAAPVAHAFGVSMEETAALAGLMANSGIKASNAGTALRSGFLRLAGPPKMAANALAQLGMTAQDLTAEQKEAAIAMESLGIKTGDTTGPQKMVSILTQLRERMQGLSQEEQLATAKAIFGTEAASGWLAVLNSAPGTFENLLQDIQKSDGAAAKMAATMKDNGGGRCGEVQVSTGIAGDFCGKHIPSAAHTRDEWPRRLYGVAFTVGAAAPSANRRHCGYGWRDRHGDNCIASGRGGLSGGHRPQGGLHRHHDFLHVRDHCTHGIHSRGNRFPDRACDCAGCAEWHHGAMDRHHKPCNCRPVGAKYSHACLPDRMGNCRHRPADRNGYPVI